MKEELLERVIRAVLYEGYVPYPSLGKSAKNQREGLTFGRVYPEAYSLAQNDGEPCALRAECLLRMKASEAAVRVSVRFLRRQWREVGKVPALLSELTLAPEPYFKVVPELLVNGELHQTWQEATEERAQVAPVPVRPHATGQVNFIFPGNRALRPLRDEANRVLGVSVRRQEALLGAIEVKVSPVTETVFKISAEVRNLTALPPGAREDCDAILMRTFAGTHLVLQAKGADFVSLLDPPAGFEAHAADCKSIGVWPVLVGDPTAGDRDAMLASPIILYDYPQIAHESCGEFRDPRLIDETQPLPVPDAGTPELCGSEDPRHRVFERTEKL